MFDALVNAFRAPDIRRRILFVLLMLVVVRGLAHVPVPGVNKEALDTVITANPFLQLLAKHIDPHCRRHQVQTVELRHTLLQCARDEVRVKY